MQTHSKKQAFEVRHTPSWGEVRKARVRTLIQLGGLIEKAGLLNICGLEAGQDLQKDPATFEGVSTLMGALLFLREEFLTEDAEVQKMLWNIRGKKALATKASAPLQE